MSCENEIKYLNEQGKNGWEVIFREIEDYEDEGGYRTYLRSYVFKKLVQNCGIVAEESNRKV